MPCRSHRHYIRTCSACKRLSRESYNRSRYSSGSSYVVYNESIDYSAGSDGGSNSSYGGGGADVDFGSSNSSYDSGSSSSYGGGDSCSSDF